MSQGINSNTKNDEFTDEEINDNDNANETFNSSDLSMKHAMMDFFITTARCIAAGLVDFMFIALMIVMSCSNRKEICRMTFYYYCNGKEYVDRHEGTIIDANNDSSDKHKACVKLLHLDYVRHMT